MEINHKREALREIEQMRQELSVAIDENHKAGFELVNFSRRLDYLKALINEESSKDILEYRERLNSMRMRGKREDE